MERGNVKFTFISPFDEVVAGEENKESKVKKEEPTTEQDAKIKVKEEDNKVEFVSRFTFLHFCRVLENLLSCSSRNAAFLVLERFWKSLPKDESFFPYMRLLLPQLDQQRPLYNLKESKLAKLYVEVLGLPPKSQQAERLLRWKDPSYSKIETTCFSDVIFIYLQNKGGFNHRSTSGDASPLSIKDINAFLDTLSSLHSNTERKEALLGLLTKTTPLEQKWFLRIVLKDMKFRLTHQSILFAFHPTALDLFNNNNDLQYVCDTCLEEMKRPVPGSIESGIFLFQPLRPMLASLVTRKKLETLLGTDALAMEPKYDGERIMLHISQETIMYWTRNAKNYTPLYGPKFDATVRECFLVGTHLAEDPSHRRKGMASEAVKVDKLENAILDGEFLVFDQNTGTFADFGGNRTFANAKEAIMLTGEEEVDGESKWFCYMVFDIVFLNGRSLLKLPYHSRRRLLQRVIREKERRMEIVPSESVTSTAQILKGLERAVEKDKEGIVLKSSTSPYVPAERKNNWLKLKIDHLSGLADSMDLIIVGGYYGTKFGRRHLSHFMLAVWDNASSTTPTDPSAKFHTVCKIGNGYTSEELMTINASLEQHWETMPNRDKIPAWLDGWRPVKSELIPEVFVHPQHSIVVEVFGFSFTESVNYRVGYTVRFPRMKRIRWDKSLQDATDRITVDSIKAASKDALRQKLANGNDELLTVLSEKWKRRREVAEAGDTAPTDSAAGSRYKSSLLPKEVAVIRETLAVATIDPNTELEDRLFEGYEFCVLFTSCESSGLEYKDYLKDKTSLEKFLLRHGAQVAANPGPRTSVLLASTATAPKVAHWIALCRSKGESNLRQYATISVVHCSWVVDCVKSGHVLPLSPRYMLYSSPSLIQKFEQVLDPYEDSYFQDCTVEQLEHSLKMAKREVNIDTSTMSLVEISKRVRQLREAVGLTENYTVGAVEWDGVEKSSTDHFSFQEGDSAETTAKIWLQQFSVVSKEVARYHEGKKSLETSPVKLETEVEGSGNSTMNWKRAPAMSFQYLLRPEEWSVSQLCSISHRILMHSWGLYDGSATSALPDFLVDSNGNVWKSA